MSASTVMERGDTAVVDEITRTVRHPVKPENQKNEGEQFNLGVLEGLISYQLRRAQLALFQNFNKYLEYTKLTPGQIGLLIKIKNNAGISQTALAKANGIERSTLGEIIDRFEKRRLVDRRKHATDRRAYALHLSVQGESLLEEVLPVMLQQESDFTRAWSKDEKQTLIRLLSKLADTTA